MLYEGRQHRRASRESLDCALMLKELVSMGVRTSSLLMHMTRAFRTQFPEWL